MRFRRRSYRRPYGGRPHGGRGLRPFTRVLGLVLFIPMILMAINLL